MLQSTILAMFCIKFETLVFGYKRLTRVLDVINRRVYLLPRNALLVAPTIHLLVFLIIFTAI